MKYRC